MNDMQDLSKHFALDENVEFKLNLPYSELLTELQRATIGLHTMWNEHFGISIVECMAAGLIVVAHASGGPRWDVVEKICRYVSKSETLIYMFIRNYRADIIETQPGSQNGFLAAEAEEYATIMAHIINMHPQDRNAIKTVARYRYCHMIFQIILHEKLCNQIRC